MTPTYNYETLGSDSFQQLCQALIVKLYPNTQCFPVGMPDGGRDASVPTPASPDSIVFQVKYRKATPNKLTTPDEICDWLEGHIAGELPKVEKLTQKGASNYIVVTNAQCSSHADTGTRDRMQAWLDRNVSIPSQVWWRDDVDRRLDGETEIKRAYGFLRDIEGLAELIGVVLPGVNQHEVIKISRRDSRVSALLKYMRHQYERDSIVKFKQAELKPALLDVFVDIPSIEADIWEHYLNLRRTHGDYLHFGPSHRSQQDVDIYDRWQGILSPAALNTFASRDGAGVPIARRLLTLHDESEITANHERIVLEGAPGQGKSTVAQYVSQVHRARLLGLEEELEKFQSAHIASAIRLPFHVDLRDLSSWLRKENPFDVTSTETPPHWANTLESFLAAQVRHESGGIAFTPADLDSVTSTTPVLLMLDGLDEVPDLNDRRAVVNAVSEGINRIEFSCPSLLTVVTSRPSAFAKSPGFPKKSFTYWALTDLTLPLVLQYTDSWLRARDIPHKEAFERRRVLGEKLGHPHIADLARNPMQLAILLWLVDKKGLSLPDKRTALYNAYMDTFLDREADKSIIVRDERDLILELHGYLAWELHCQAELGKSRGSISEGKLKQLLKRYLNREGYTKVELVDQLFTGITQRVMVLTSRVENTFEFEVQPLREYFAARYLYSTAKVSPQGQERTGTRSDRFEALLRNPYWLNVSRFYAGFSDKGELANLADLLETLYEDSDFGLVTYPREVSATLLRDQVFAQKPRSAAKVFEMLVSEESLTLLRDTGLDKQNLSFAADSGHDFGSRIKDRVEKSLTAGHPDLASAALLPLNCDLNEIRDWWLAKWSALKGGLQRKHWILLAGAAEILPNLSDEQMAELNSAMPEDVIFWYLVTASGSDYIPKEGTDAYKSLLYAYREGLSYAPIYDVGSSILARSTRTTSPAFLRALIGGYSATNAFRRPGVPEGNGVHRDTVLAVQALLQCKNPRKDLDSWDQAHQNLRYVLGGECKRTLALALTGGLVRSGNVSRALGGELLAENLSPVYRARYARQRAGDQRWWEAQIREVQSADDAWFVAGALMMYAPRDVVAASLRLLDKHLREFSYNDIVSLTNVAVNPRRRGQMDAVNLDERAAARLSHQGAYLLSHREPMKSAFPLLDSASKRAKDKEFSSLYAQRQIDILVRKAVQENGMGDSSRLKECVKAARKGTYSPPLRVQFLGEMSVTSEGARNILSDRVDMEAMLVSRANDALTVHLNVEAKNLAGVADADGWFQEE
ncbi:NACHT domain-containing protein [Streptomyces sp. NPDC056004]|uniref:NACHT domain-containing protein n=1 Tax=Streptomyces sp. NPDC056004 TaxID=3345677 RepID=UPI0035DF10FE